MHWAGDLSHEDNEAGKIATTQCGKIAKPQTANCFGNSTVKSLVSDHLKCQVEVVTYGRSGRLQKVVAYEMFHL